VATILAHASLPLNTEIHLALYQMPVSPHCSGCSLPVRTCWDNKSDSQRVKGAKWKIECEVQEMTPKFNFSGFYQKHGIARYREGCNEFVEDAAEL
jgi:hypothetical protein